MQRPHGPMGLIFSLSYLTGHVKSVDGILGCKLFIPSILCSFKLDGLAVDDTSTFSQYAAPRHINRVAMLYSVLAANNCVATIFTLTNMAASLQQLHKLAVENVNATYMWPICYVATRVQFDMMYPAVCDHSDNCLTNA